MIVSTHLKIRSIISSVRQNNINSGYQYLLTSPYKLDPFWCHANVIPCHHTAHHWPRNRTTLLAINNACCLPATEMMAAYLLTTYLCVGRLAATKRKRTEYLVYGHWPEIVGPISILCLIRLCFYLISNDPICIGTTVYQAYTTLINFTIYWNLLWQPTVVLGIILTGVVPVITKYYLPCFTNCSGKTMNTNITFRQLNQDRNKMEHWHWAFHVIVAFRYECM